MQTVLNCMHVLGFRYVTRMKVYFFDVHEKKETKVYRKGYSGGYFAL